MFWIWVLDGHRTSRVTSGQAAAIRQVKDAKFSVSRLAYGFC
jgi:hypothetical protein